MENPIKILRKTKGLRQVDLAQRVGLSTRTISGIELGDGVGMHMQTAQKLANYFHVNAVTLLADYMVWRAETVKSKENGENPANNLPPGSENLHHFS